MLDEKRFNRYIVECKATQQNTDTATNNGFNRYIVECKVIFASKIILNNFSFNRYIVECKGEINIQS